MDQGGHIRRVFGTAFGLVLAADALDRGIEQNVVKSR